MAEPQERAGAALEAVIFDWGGTLTPWHTLDMAEEAAALARAVVDAGPDAAVSLRAATEAVWALARDEQRSATIADIFTHAGLAHDEELLTAYRDFWEPHTLIDPDVPELFRRLREDGLKVGVLSNTVWPRTWHEELFARDGVLDLIDGAVYTSEVPWTKPSPEAFLAAAEAGRRRGAGALRVRGGPAVRRHLGREPRRDADDPRARTRRSRPTQLGHTDGTPDAVAHRLADVHGIVARWR